MLHGKETSITIRENFIAFAVFISDFDLNMYVNTYIYDFLYMIKKYLSAQKCICDINIMKT